MAGEAFTPVIHLPMPASMRDELGLRALDFETVCSWTDGPSPLLGVPCGHAATWHAVVPCGHLTVPLCDEHKARAERKAIRDHADPKVRPRCPRCRQRTDPADIVFEPIRRFL